MDQGESKLNPSSILDLKAELRKQYEVFNRSKLEKKTDFPKPSSFKNKGDNFKDKKQKPISIKKNQEPVDTEEDQILLKSRLALEAKAKIYDKIVSDNVLIDDEQNETYLVDFQRKVLYGDPVPDKVDTSASSVSVCKIPPMTQIPVSTPSSANTTIPSPKLNPEQPIHYQNIQFNEIRDHGTAYFAFSMDDKKRKEQMDDLNSMRKDTEKTRQMKQKLERKNKIALQARLAKICERKNIDQSIISSVTGDVEPNVAEESQPQEVDLSSIPLPTEVEPEPSQEATSMEEPKIRPWDIGKDTLQYFVPEKRKRKTQNEYVEERRSEREYEFAPPSSY